MADPAVRTRFVDFGAEPLANSPEEPGRHISAEIAKWRQIITRGRNHRGSLSSGYDVADIQSRGKS
jgi:hypothetical protein